MEAGFKRIDEVRSGDRVWSYNVETGELALKVVKEVFVLENGELLHAGAGLLQATWRLGTRSGHSPGMRGL